MGGIGSGGWYRWGKKANIDGGIKLDLRELIRRGFVKAGFSSSICIMRWVSSFDGSETSSVSYDYNLQGREHGLFTLRYKVNESENINLPIQIASTKPNYGGRRYWFICPLSKHGRPCQRRVAKLYLPVGASLFGCRHCHDLPYRSQSLSAHDRSLQRAQQLHMQLGGDGSMLDYYDPIRPKGMHNKTYLKKLNQIHTAMERMDRYTPPWLRMFEVMNGYSSHH